MPTLQNSNNPQYLKTIPDLVPIYDRSQELDSLKQWILTEQCRSIVIYGTAGIGKTALVRQLLEDIKDESERLRQRISKFISLRCG
jgi:Cdc6-like AAA superfamily ATPase